MEHTTLQSITFKNEQFIPFRVWQNRLNGVDAETDQFGSVDTDTHCSHTIMVYAYVPTNNNYLLIPYSNIYNNWAFRVLDRATNEPVTDTNLGHVVYGVKYYTDLMM